VKILWFTWETQRRNASLSSELGAKLYKFDYSREDRLSRYLKSARDTIAALKNERPDIVITQCPSIVLVTLLTILKPFCGYSLVIDAHNISVENLDNPSLWSRVLHRWCFRRADFIIVSNLFLFGEVENFGGLALPLADPLPELHSSGSQLFKSAERFPVITLVCSFASDEPIREFLDGAQQVDSPFQLFVTGRRSKAGDLLARENDARIRFTDFLSSGDFDALLKSSDLVVDLTTRDNCLVCGAYEGLAAGKVLMLSDSAINRRTFPRGAIFVRNDVAGFKAGLEEFFRKRQEISAEVPAMLSEFKKNWATEFEAIKQKLSEIRSVSSR
jgi:hypothetical protein